MAKIKWQQSEIDYVVANYSKFQAVDIAAHLNESENLFIILFLGTNCHWASIDDEIEYLKIMCAKFHMNKYHLI